MSVVSKNPFDLLGDDGDESPSPAPAKTAAPAQKAEAPAPQKAVPGAAPRGGAAGGGRGGRYPSRGGPRNVYRESEPRNTGPTSGDGVAEGMETPGGFDGERIPNPRKGAHVRDAHTKGPRGSRPAKNYTSGGHSSRGRGHVQGSNVPASGGERRQFERRSGGLPDSQKKIDQGWGANEGAAELTAEVEGEKDAVAEENTPATPAAEGEDGGWGTGDAPAEGGEAAAVEPAAPAEPEEVQKSLEEYLAERAASGLAGIGKKEGRQVNSETLEGTAFRREAIDDFFTGKEKTAAKGNKAPKKEKVFIEFDGQFASPAGSRRPRGDGAERGARGGRGGRGRGGPRGGSGPRGGARGGAGRGRSGAAGGPINTTDESAFPALGA